MAGLAERIVYIDLDSVVVGDLVRPSPSSPVRARAPPLTLLPRQSFLLQYAGDCMVLGCAQMVNEGRTEGYNSRLAARLCVRQPLMRALLCPDSRGCAA